MKTLWELAPVGIESGSSVAQAPANVLSAQLDLISNDGRKEFMACGLSSPSRRQENVERAVIHSGIAAQRAAQVKPSRSKIPHLLIHKLYKLGLLETLFCLKIQGFAAGCLRVARMRFRAIALPGLLKGI